MKNLTVIGLDLAKNVFQVHGMDDRGHKVCGARLKRSEVLSYFANLPPVLVGMEACGGAHEWARQLCKLGHQVKMMAPQHVKAYVQGNKTDARDAAAIAEAGLEVQAVNKVAEGRPHIVDMIKNGEIALVINTVEERRNAIADSRQIRTSALLARVTTFTTIFGAEAAVDGMKAMRGNLDVYSVQELHAQLSH